MRTTRMLSYRVRKCNCSTESYWVVFDGIRYSKKVNKTRGKTVLVFPLVLFYWLVVVTKWEQKQKRATDQTP